MAFEIRGLEDLQRDIENVVVKHPDEVNKKMKSLGNQFKKDCNAKMPANYHSGKRAIPKSWEIRSEQQAHVVTEVQIRNKAPHFHLVENGHEKYIRGKSTGGFVPGKHYAERTRQEYEDKFPDEIEEFLDEILRGNNL